MQALTIIARSLNFSVKTYIITSAGITVGSRQRKGRNLKCKHGSKTRRVSSVARQKGKGYAHIYVYRKSEREESEQKRALLLV